MVNFTRTKPWTIYPKPGVVPFGYASVNPRLTKYSLRVQLLVWADFLCTVKNTHSHFFGRG